MHESDLLLEVAANIAKEDLREVVTMPADEVTPSISRMDQASGRQLPPASCAFKNCTFSVAPQSSTHQQYSDDVEHPWDQILRTHVQQAHAEDILNIAETLLGREDAELHMWDLYKGALSFQERLRSPMSGKTIDRRVFAHLSHVCNDNRIRSQMCFLCNQIKLDTGWIRSDITFRNGRWLFSLPRGSFVKNFSMHKFNAKHRQPGSPLAYRGPDYSADFSYNHVRLHPEV